MAIKSGVGILVVVCVAVSGCGSSGDGDVPSSGAIEFEHSFNASQQVLFTAQGDAVDQGLICPDASGVQTHDEDEDGNVLTEERQFSLFAGFARFVERGFLVQILPPLLHL